MGGKRFALETAPCSVFSSLQTETCMQCTKMGGISETEDII